MSANQAKRNSPREDEDRKTGAPTTGPVEWIVAGAGVILFSVMLAYLLFLAVNDEADAPPMPVITHSAPVPGKAGFVIDYVVTNEGKAAASQLVVTGQLLRGETVIEERNGLIDYVAQDSSQRGSLLFQHDPAGYRTSIAISSFTLP